MNPRYVVTYNGNIAIEGPKAFGMGKDPIWNDFNEVNHVVQLDDTKSGDIEVNFMNSGDLLCGLKFTVPQLIALNNKNTWYDSKRSGKDSGQFKMQVVYDGPRNEEAKNDTNKPVSFSAGQIATGMVVGSGI